MRVCEITVRPGDVGADDFGGVGIEPIEEFDELLVGRHDW